MALNVLGQKLYELITEIPNHNPYAEIPIYQIMPNHVQLFVCIDGNVRGNDVRDAACHVSTGGNNKMRDIANRCGKLTTLILSCRLCV